MDKCEGCPLEGTDDKFEGYCHLFGEVGHRENVADCHLTPDHKRIIKAMIRGAFDCDHCKWLGKCDPSPTDPEEFCAAWQERKEGEDG